MVPSGQNFLHTNIIFKYISNILYPFNGKGAQTHNPAAKALLRLQKPHVLGDILKFQCLQLSVEISMCNSAICRGDEFDV